MCWIAAKNNPKYTFIQNTHSAAAGFKNEVKKHSFCNISKFKISDTVLLSRKRRKKCADVLPTGKVPALKDFEELRPINILPAITKLFEEPFINQVKQCISEYAIIPDNQTGFRQN